MSIDEPHSESELDRRELFWRDLQPWLLEHGYQLRPRFRPGWQPSWLSKGGFPFEYEDGCVFLGDRVMDATQVSTGHLVALKRLTHQDEDKLNEISLSDIWSREPILRQSDNHCAPVLDALKHPKKPLTILVTPFLIRWNKPRFDSVIEGLDFVHQFLTGLRFLHRQRIAHRDIKHDNVMMDPTFIYPEGFHPNRFDATPDTSGVARRVSRTDASPKYFLIDFGLACHYPSQESPLVQPVIGGDKTVPEFQGEGRTKLHNPFPTDIYYAGNLLRQTFTTGHPDAARERPGTYSFEFLVPLLRDMTMEDPSLRPTIEDVMTRLVAIEKRLGWVKLRSRIGYRDESWFLVPFRLALHWGRVSRRLFKGHPTVPEHYRTSH